MILVTGARGVVGQPLCKKLAASSHQYLAVSRADSSSEHNVKWDLYEPMSASLLGQISTCSELIHCAPLWLLPLHFANLIKAGIRRVVAFSSTSVIAKKTSSDPHEAQLVKSLEDAEQQLSNLAQQHGVALTILRPSMIYGYGLDENISHIAKRIKRIKVMPLAGKGAGLRQPVHADDLVDAALAVLNQDLAGVRTYNVGGGETISYRLMVERIFRALEMKPRFIVVPLWLYRILLRTLSMAGSFNYTAAMADRMNVDLVYDFQRADEDFGYLPQKFLLHPMRDLPQ